MNVLISGASRGLGAELCKKFLEKGHRVFACVRKKEELGELRTIKNKERLSIISMDVAEKESIETARREIGKYTDRLDILVNNAGVLLNRNGNILQDSYEELETTFKVNIVGLAYINNVFWDLLLNSQEATVINISSEISSINGVGERFAAYCMSKTAVAQYGFILKDTCKKRKVDMRIFSVHPGRMKTTMGAENGEISPKESAEGIYRIAVGEILKKNERIYVNYKGESMIS